MTPPLDRGKTTPPPAEQARPLRVAMTMSLASDRLGDCVIARAEWSVAERFELDAAPRFRRDVTGALRDEVGSGHPGNRPRLVISMGLS